jgi:hypothetical protein
MSTGYVAADAVVIAGLGVVAAWQVVVLSRRSEPLWRAVIGWSGIPLRLFVALLLISIVKLATDGRSSPGAWLGLAVAAALLAWCVVTLLRSRNRHRAS